MKKFRLEKDFQKWLLAELKKIPYSWIFVPPTRSIRGVPDIILSVGGVFIALELKRKNAPKDSTRERLQEYTIEKIKQSGGLAWSRVTPENVALILEELLEISRKHGLTQE